jgi:hypothetical protein
MSNEPVANYMNMMIVAALIKKSGEFYRRKFDKLRTNENKNKV